MAIDVLEDAAPHARLPVAQDVRGEVAARLVRVGHRGEEVADAVGHLDQVICFHAASGVDSLRISRSACAVGDPVDAAREADQAQAGRLRTAHRQGGGAEMAASAPTPARTVFCTIS